VEVAIPVLAIIVLLSRSTPQRHRWEQRRAGRAQGLPQALPLPSSSSPTSASSGATSWPGRSGPVRTLFPGDHHRGPHRTVVYTFSARVHTRAARERGIITAPAQSTPRPSSRGRSLGSGAGRARLAGAPSLRSTLHLSVPAPASSTLPNVAFRYGLARNRILPADLPQDHANAIPVVGYLRVPGGALSLPACRFPSVWRALAA